MIPKVAADRLGESQRTRDEDERERQREWSCAGLEKRRKIQNARNVDGGNREIERRRRWEKAAAAERQQLPLSGRLAVIMRNKLPL